MSAKQVLIPEDVAAYFSDQASAKSEFHTLSFLVPRINGK